MWVERIVVGGFRSLRGTYTFAQGLNVVIGPNEAGKSSLHEALVRSFHGFSKQERRRARGLSHCERLAPWDGGAYGLNARVRDGDRFFDVEWDFASHQVQVTDERGRDHSDSVLRSGGEIALGAFLLGVDLDDFRQVCCIDQDALLGVRHSPSLGVALQEAVANVSGDVPVESAVARLNDFLRSIGARTDSLAPTPTGRLATLARERDSLRAAIEESERVRHSLEDVSTEIATLRQENEDRVHERDLVRQRQLLSETRALAERIEEARRLHAVTRAAPPPAAELEQPLVDAITIARDRLAAVESELAVARREAATAEPDVERLRDEQRALVVATGGIEAYRSLDTSHEGAVRQAWAALSEIPADTAPVTPPTRDPELGRYRSDRQHLLALDRPRTHPRLRRVGWVGLVVATVGLAWAVRKLVRRLRGPRPSALADALAAYGAGSLEELDRRCAEEDAAILAAEQMERERAERAATHDRRRAELLASLERVLDDAGAASAPLAERVASYVHACERHAELVEQQVALERVQRHLADSLRPGERLGELEREHLEAQSALRAAYASVEIDAPTFEEAERALAERQAEEKIRRRARQESDAARQALASLLGEETLDELVDRHAAAERRHGEHVALHGVLTDETGDPAQLAGRLHQLEQALQEDAAQLASREREVELLETSLGDPAAAKERLAAVDAEHAALLEARDAVGLARSVMKDAGDEISREFAPHLNEALRRNLGRITGGRYDEAMVDTDLSVKVVIRGSGHVVSADDLSRATKDQIFLVQRLEIARLLAPTKGVAPLLLDDPFAHYDRDRLRYGIEVLGEAANDRQVILFSEDLELADVVNEVCAGCHVIELRAPALVGGEDSHAR